MVLLLKAGALFARIRDYGRASCCRIPLHAQRRFARTAGISAERRQTDHDSSARSWQRHAATRSAARWLAAAVVWGMCGTLLQNPASGAVVGEIVGPGASSYPIAVSALRSLGGQDVDAAMHFADVLSRDLTLSGYFRVLDRDAYIDDPQTSGTDVQDIEFQNWSTIGARALVKGTLEQTARGLLVEVRLFDVTERRAIAAKRYRAAPKDLPRAAHRFADEILLVFTGIPGPFDTRIAFTSGGGGQAKELFVLTFDAPAPRQVTSDRSIIVSPSWSADGGRLLYTSYRDGPPSLYELEVDTGRLRRFLGSGGLSVGGAWSPDGKLLAVTRELGGNPEIVLLHPDGKIARRLTSHPGIDVSPSWSPDGREIAFCSDRLGTPQIFVAGLDGAVRRVTFSGSYNTSPAWSPRGSEIAYTGRVAGRFHVFIVDAYGGASRQLTYSAGDNEDPRWAPDGRYLVFSSTRTGSARLFLMDRTGRIQKQLTHGTMNDTSPAWSPRRK